MQQHVLRSSKPIISFEDTFGEALGNVGRKNAFHRLVGRYRLVVNERYDARRDMSTRLGFDFVDNLYPFVDPLRVFQLKGVGSSIFDESRGEGRTSMVK